MTDPQVEAETQTAPEPEAQSETAETPQETSPQYLTREEVDAIIEEKVAARQAEIDKQLEAAYKTLRRGEGKSDTLLKKVERLEQEQFENSLRGLEPQQQDLERLKRQSLRDSESRNAQADPNAEVASFQAWATSVLAEEGIAGTDPILTEAFQKYGEGWTSQADLRVAMTRAIAKVRTEEAKKAKAESADREKKAREEERTKLRNENRQAEPRLDKGTPAATAKNKSLLTMTQEEWDAFNASRRKG